MRRYLVVLLAMIGLSAMAAIPASSSPAPDGAGEVDHLINCYLTASQPVKQGAYVVGSGAWSCTPSKPDIIEMCVWIELNFFGYWERNSPTVCDGGRQSGSRFVTGGCQPGAYQYRTVAVINAFHGSWDSATVRTLPVSIRC